MITLVTLLVLAGNGSPPPDAAPGRRGLVSAGAQSFSGQKSFVDGGVLVDGFAVMTATTAAMTLYVDQDGGSDSNACTGGDGGVCLTINGAINKVPKRVRHNVTVNVAAGTYAENATINHFGLETGVTFTLAGTLTMFTPATGTAAGTLTGAAGVASGGYVQRVTDSGQSWTVDNLKGRFFTVAGTSRVIVSNTATTLDVVCPTAFGAGNAYTINDPATAVTTLLVQGNQGSAATIAASNLTLSTPISVRATDLLLNHQLTNCRVTPGTAGISSAKATLTRTYVQSTSSALSCTTGSLCAFVESYAVSSGVSIGMGAAVLAGGATLNSASNNSVFENTAISGNVFVVTPNVQQTSFAGTRGRFVCPAGSTGTGILPTVGAVAGYEVVAGPTRFQNQFSATAFALEVENCAVGFKGYGDVWISNTSNNATAWYFNNVTTAFDLGYGARAILGTGSTFTFTGVTNQFRLDGTVFTLANLDAANPKLLSTPYFTLLAR